MMYVASQKTCGRIGRLLSKAFPYAKENKRGGNRFSASRLFLWSSYSRVLFSVLFLGIASQTRAATLDLSWTDNSSDESGFKIERSTDGTNFSEITSVSANITNYSDTGLSDSTQYWYRVRAYNGAGDSGYTNIANATTTATNSLPTISDISNQTIDQDANTGALNFTIGDAETAVGSLTLSGTSSNTSLVPNGNIVFGGSGASRTVTVTPQAGATGTTTITVTVNDGTDTSNDTFTVTVNAVGGGNNAPTISDISNQTIDEDSNTGALNFTVGDAETAAGSLTLSGTSSNTSLVPNGNIVFGGSGASRTVTVTPLPDTDGTATITITVNDGTDDTSDTFTLTVTDTDAPPSGGGGSGGGGSGGGGAPIENRVPTITEIENITILQDTSTGDLGFTIWDAETASKELILTATSSNEVLVPQQNMVFSGISSNRKIHVTPAPGESGSATISVTVSDGEDSVAETFLLTVTKEAVAPVIVVQPIGASVLEGEEALFTVVASGYPEPTYQWQKNGADIAGATSQTYIIGTTLTEDEGLYSVIVSNSEGTITSSDAELFVDTLVILQQPVSVSIFEDGTARLSVEAMGDNLTYQWYIGETGDTSSPIDGAISSTYTTPPLTETTSFWVQVASDNGQVLSVERTLDSDAATISIGEQLELLSNTSIRAELAPSTNSLIAGFVIKGEGSKRILVRGIGPSIPDPNIQQKLEDPAITLFALNQGQFEVAGQNDDWSDAENAALVESSSAQVGAFPLQPGSKDAAILIDLPAGNYGAQISGVSGALGTALVEIYDVDSTVLSVPSNVLSNISTRGLVGQGNNVVIAGFVVTGTESKRFLVRAVGPELADQGVANFLDDPVIDIYKNGVLISNNNNWNHFTDTIATVSEEVGAFPMTPRSKSSAMVLWLEPGIYGAVAASASGSTGEALVEVYEAP